MSGAWTRVRRAWRRFWQRAQPHGVVLPPQPVLDLHPSVGPDAAATLVERALDPGQTQGAFRRHALARTIAPAFRLGGAPATIDTCHAALAAARDEGLRQLGSSRVEAPVATQLRGLYAPALRLPAPSHEDWNRARAERVQQERR